MLNKLIKGIACFPLIIYLGTVAGFFVLLFTLLSINLGVQASLEQLSLYLSNSLGEFIVFSAVVFALVFTASTFANKELYKVSSMEYKMWREQKATRTLSPWFTPLHDWLRLRNIAYRRWHTFSFASSIHTLVLIIFTVAIINTTTFHTQQLLVAGPPMEPEAGDPPPNAPTMNAPTDITNSSIRWNIVDTNTNETAHTFNRVDDTQVASVASTTTATTGTAYSHNETSLSPDTSYTRHAHATNVNGQGPASTNATTRTLANTPGAPTLSSISPTTITVTINTNSNPSSTEFAIQETTTGKFVQSSGLLSATTVWNTYVIWGGAGGKIVTGLSVNADYTFRVIARNGDNVETSYSSTATAKTLAQIPNSPTLTVVSTTSINIKINENGNPSSVEYVIFNVTAGKYVYSNGSLNSTPQWNTKGVYGGDGGVTNTGLTKETDYTYKVKARNGNNIETNYSISSTINTGSPSGTSSGGDDPPPPGGGGGGDPPGGGATDVNQLTVNIDILGVDSQTGDYRVDINYSIKEKILKGELTGDLKGSSISGNFNGEFADVPVDGAFSGKVVDGKLSEATMVLAGWEDPLYGDTLLVQGIVEIINSETGEVVARVDNKPVNTVDITNTALGILATVIAAATFASSLFTQAIGAGLQPLQWIFFSYVPRRKRRVWGRVLDSRNHMPVPGVRVELHKLTEDKFLKRIMTDGSGRYGFVVESPGSYVVAAHNALYYDYQSESIVISDPKQEIIGKDIFVTPNEAEFNKNVLKTAGVIKFFKALTYLHWPLLIFGTILSLYLVVTEVTASRVVVVSIYAVIWAIEMYQLTKKHSFGKVINKSSSEAEEHAVVQLTRQDGKVNSVAATTVSDKNGKFFFVVKRGDYNLSVTKGGFEPALAEFAGEAPSVTVELLPLVAQEPRPNP